MTSSPAPALSSAISSTPITLTGPIRAPRQMLAEQTYNGQLSVHDGDTAEKLGLAGAPIEGPTHFSQFDPLLASVWGDRWFTSGVISSHFLNMVFEGEEVQATVVLDGPGALTAKIYSAKADGTPVLEGTASIDGDLSATVLAERLAKAQERDPGKLHILDKLSVGQRGAEAETITVNQDDFLGNLYPFSLAQKLSKITESVSYYDADSSVPNPFGGAIMPIEMMSVITNTGSKRVGFEVRQPSIGLFIDLEVRLLNGPVLVGRSYRLDREIVALGQSRRTESYWTLTTLTDDKTDVPTAQVLLHSGVFKDSYPDYPAS